MKKVSLILTLFMGILGFSQNDLSKVLKRYHTEEIPYISVEELQKIETNVFILDAREKKEFDVSHLKNAIYVGYKTFNIESVQQKIKNKDSKIVVYCSLGIRSETIALKLKKVGYHNVENLFGGIFEWKNHDLPIYNSNNEITDKVHAYSQTWGKWLEKGIKVYD